MSNTLNPEQGDALKQAWLNLPKDAQEAMVNVVFVPELINFLGFDSTEIVPEYSTGKGGDKVDYALRHNLQEDIFIQTKNNPQILLELKGRDINLQENSPKYKSTLKQLKGYLLAPKCRNVQWGIITNSNQIQLFRKHGKVIYPATPCLEMREDNIFATVKLIKDKINQTKRGLTVAIYNNKGGVGKTTTVANLAAALTIKRKKVLIVDFDANQRDLTNLLKAQVGQQTLYNCLASKNQVDCAQVIYPHRIKNKQGDKELRFDVIPADTQLSAMGEDNLRQNFSFRRLRQVLDSFKSDYDYILIDSPPNWRFFSVSAIYAADVVLIPTKHNNLFSLENAAVAIKEYITQTQEIKQNGSPIALPIFFNGETITDAQRRTVYQAIDNLISRYKKEYSFDLSPYFYPRWTRGKRDRFIFEIPNYAVIAGAAFAHIPSVYKNKIAREYYMNLAKEYFFTMSNLSDIGNLMHLHLDYIKPGKETNANKFLIFATAHNLTRMEGRNWIPVIVKEVGEDQYQVIGNSFIYEAAKEAELEKLWCIIADDNPETDELVKVLAREQTPRINLSTASKEEIQLALDFLTKRDPTLFKGVRVSFFINRLYKAPRQYWRSLEPIIRLKCNVNKGRKLDALEEVFYLTPQRQRILNLRNLSLKELKDIARAQGVIRYTQKTKTELLELFLK